MMQNCNLPASVRTVHVLSSGQLIWSREEYEKVKDRFAWVDQQFILSEILKLRRLTDSGGQSIIAIYETDRSIRQFMNIDHSFHPADLNAGI